MMTEFWQLLMFCIAASVVLTAAYMFGLWWGDGDD
jgi:hypothetical protein